MFFLGFGGSFWRPFGHLFRVFGGLGAKWHPGPKNVEKVTPKTKNPYSIFTKNLCFFAVDFPVFFWIVLGCLFLISVSKVSQMRAPWEHFSRHFAAKLERRNLWFRVHQTIVFMVFRGWVWKYWATFFKWFSKLDLGVSFYVFL